LTQVAKESAGKFNPKVKIEAYHANIKDLQFDIAFFKQFQVVFNALDNVDARRHVNKMCIASDVPMVDSGTTGFQGHAQVIVKVIWTLFPYVKRQLTVPRESQPATTVH